MAVKVFLIGRPGSGKTTAFHNIEQIAQKNNKKVTRFREYTILREMLYQDDFKDKFRLTAFGGFDILDFSVLNESARQLEKQVLNYIFRHKVKSEIIFLELARDDYSQAMKCFSRKFLQDAYFFFVEADLEECIMRIHSRIAHPGKTDGHYVSDYILKSYYHKSNFSYINSEFESDYGIKKSVMAVENMGSLEEFAEKAEGFAEVIFSNEFNNSKKIRLFWLPKQWLNLVCVTLLSLCFLVLCLTLPNMISLFAASESRFISALLDPPPLIYVPGFIVFVLLCLKEYIISWFHFCGKHSGNDKMDV